MLNFDSDYIPTTAKSAWGDRGLVCEDLLQWAPLALSLFQEAFALGKSRL